MHPVPTREHHPRLRCKRGNTLSWLKRFPRTGLEIQERMIFVGMTTTTTFPMSNMTLDKILANWNITLLSWFFDNSAQGFIYLLQQQMRWTPLQWEHWNIMALSNRILIFILLSLFKAPDHKVLSGLVYFASIDGELTCFLLVEIDNNMKSLNNSNLFGKNIFKSFTREDILLREPNFKHFITASRFFTYKSSKTKLNKSPTFMPLINLTKLSRIYKNISTVPMIPIAEQKNWKTF